MAFKSIRGSRVIAEDFLTATDMPLLPGFSALGGCSSSKIIPRISRARS